MTRVKTAAQIRQQGNPFQPRRPNDPGFLLGSSIVAMTLASVVLLGLAYLGVLA